MLFQIIQQTASCLATSVVLAYRSHSPFHLFKDPFPYLQIAFSCRCTLVKVTLRPEITMVSMIRVGYTLLEPLLPLPFAYITCTVTPDDACDVAYDSFSIGSSPGQRRPH